jgi:hypothetical protein
MKLLNIESSKLTPGISFSPDTNVLNIYGFSLPENAAEFYEPIINWLEELAKEVSSKRNNIEELNVIFKLVYFNSSSLRQLLDIFNGLNELVKLNFKVNITWQYDSEDPQMAEAGKELSDITKVPINVVSYN